MGSTPHPKFEACPGASAPSTLGPLKAFEPKLQSDAPGWDPSRGGGGGASETARRVGVLLAPGSQETEAHSVGAPVLTSTCKTHMPRWYLQQLPLHAQSRGAGPRGKMLFSWWTSEFGRDLCPPVGGGVPLCCNHRVLAVKNVLQKRH